MRPAAVLVIHRDAMVAEGIAAALARYPGIVPIASATTPSAADRWAERADAVALDAGIAGADEVASRLRRVGVRVVLIGEPVEGQTRIPLRSPVAALARALVPAMWNGHAPTPERLTERERQVLGLVARGMAAKQVARQLRISPKTVEIHKTHIYRKLGVPNQAAAVSVAFAGKGGGPWNPSST
jgi:DNA-binding NarL/FixJ family response regulator